MKSDFFSVLTRSLRPLIKLWNLSFALVIDAIAALIKKGFLSSTSSFFLKICLEKFDWFFTVVS